MAHTSPHTSSHTSPLTSPHTWVQIGTALFAAPEIFLNVRGGAYDAEAVDVWSCGVVLFMLLFGGHPFLSPADAEQPKVHGRGCKVEGEWGRLLCVCNGCRWVGSAGGLLRSV